MEVVKSKRFKLYSFIAIAIVLQTIFFFGLKEDLLQIKTYISILRKSYYKGQSIPFIDRDERAGKFYW